MHACSSLKSAAVKRGGFFGGLMPAAAIERGVNSRSVLPKPSGFFHVAFCVTVLK